MAPPRLGPQGLGRRVAPSRLGLAPPGLGLASSGLAQALLGPSGLAPLLDQPLGRARLPPPGLVIFPLAYRNPATWPGFFLPAFFYPLGIDESTGALNARSNDRRLNSVHGCFCQLPSSPREAEATDTAPAPGQR